MSVGANLVWELRTAGDDTNGGGFDSSVSVPGTDFSQQNSAQVSYTDIVINGSDNTKITSAGNPFTSAHVGNVIYITSGTGFTVSRYVVNSVAAGVATMSSAVGTVSSTGGVGKLGGALASPGEMGKCAQTHSGSGGHLCWVKAGTYTMTTSTQNVSGGKVNSDRITFIGYQTTRADYGTRPVITANAAGYQMFISALLKHLELDGASTATTGCFGNQLVGCRVHHFVGIGAQSITYARDTDSYNNGSHGFTNSSSGFCYNCKAYSNTGNGFSGIFSCSRCLAYSNSGHGFADGYCHECTSYGHTTAAQGGFYISSDVQMESCISYGNYYNWQCAAGSYITQFGGYQYCASGGATQADAGPNLTGRVPLAALNHTSLSADPFTNAAGGDFSLNSTAGGGAACKGIGVPASQDVGQIQTATAPSTADYKVQISDLFVRN